MDFMIIDCIVKHWKDKDVYLHAKNAYLRIMGDFLPYSTFVCSQNVYNYHTLWL